MDFNDTPEESLFRAEARDFLERARAAQERFGAARRNRRRLPRAREGLAEAEVRERLGVPELAEGVRRPRCDADAADHLESGRIAIRRADRAVRDRPRHVRTDDDRVRLRAAETRNAAADGVRRARLVSAVQRTGRRFRPRCVADESRTRRRRVDHQRPEDLDLRRALQRLGHPRDALRCDRAEAQRADVLLPRHAFAGRNGEADQADLRRRQLQRGVLRRRADSRRTASGRGRSGLAGVADDADERTTGGRQRRRRRLRRRAGARATPSSSTAHRPFAIRPCARSWRTGTANRAAFASPTIA